VGIKIMKYTGSLDDIIAINAYLDEVQKFIDDLKAKHDI
jgi:hypothetical protein